MRYNIAHLAADWDIADATFFDGSGLKEIIRVEANLVVKEHDEFSGKPVSNGLLALAVISLPFIAHIELNRDLLGLLGVIIAPDHQVLPVHALELLAVGFNLGARRGENGIDGSVRPLGET